MSSRSAQEVLGDAIQPDGGLFDLGWYLSWAPGRPRAVLDGEFTAEELSAIAAHMRGIGS